MEFFGSNLSRGGRIEPSKRDMCFVRLGSFQNVKPTLASSCNCVNSRRPQSVVVSPDHCLMVGHQHRLPDPGFHLVLRNHHRLESGHDNSPVGKKQMKSVNKFFLLFLFHLTSYLLRVSCEPMPCLPDWSFDHPPSRADLALQIPVHRLKKKSNEN